MSDTIRIYPPTLESFIAPCPLDESFERKALTEAQRVAIDLELERYLQLSSPEFIALTIIECVGVGTGQVCGKEVHSDNGVLCAECWDRLDGYEPRPRASIFEALLCEFQIRFGCDPAWKHVVDIINL